MKYLVIFLLAIIITPAFADIEIFRVDLNCPLAFKDDYIATLDYLTMCPFSGIFGSSSGASFVEKIPEQIVGTITEQVPEPGADFFIHPDDLMILLLIGIVFFVIFLVKKRIKKEPGVTIT